MSNAALALVVVATGTYVLKAAAPLALAGRQLPARLQSLVALLPAALLASLALISTVGDGTSVVIDARLVGVVVAGIALWRRAPFVVVVIVASVATALTRLLS